MLSLNISLFQILTFIYIYTNDKVLWWYFMSTEILTKS